MAKCKYCGRERRCIGGYYYPVFEECSCGGYEREQRESEERSREIAAKRASCSHEWRYNVMDGVAVKYCPKCGALEQA